MLLPLLGEATLRAQKIPVHDRAVRQLLDEGFAPANRLSTRAEGARQATSITAPQSISFGSVTPASGSTAGATLVEIGGSGFASGATVTFGGTQATAVVFNSSSSLLATSPPHAAGAVDVVVTNPDAQSVTATAVFDYVAPPAISSLDVVQGSVTGGTTVTITGSGFVAGAAVTFGGVPAASVTFNAATSLDVTTPSHADGEVDVTVANPDGTTARKLNAFTFLPQLGDAAFTLFGTAQGKMLLRDNSDVYLFDGAGTILVQATGASGNIDTVAETGSGASPGDILGLWRRGTDDAYVSLNASLTKVQYTNPRNAAFAMNPEQATLADGCAFMILSDTATMTVVRRVYQVDPLTGATTQISGSLPVPPDSGTPVQIGARRIASSGCETVYSWDSSGTGANHTLYYFTGTPPGAVIDSGEIHPVIGMRDGRIVYVKKTSGVDQIFLYDSTLPSPAPQQLTAYSDADQVLRSPATDGRHVAWIRHPSAASKQDIAFYGGIDVTVPATVTALGNAGNYAFNLQGGAIFWNDASGVMRAWDESGFRSVSPAPGNSGSGQMADGFIAMSTDAGSYLLPAASPETGNALNAPMIVMATRAGGEYSVEWDRVIGATSYNVYYAEVPGVTTSNYASLAGGTKLAAVTPPLLVGGLASERNYSFVVSAIVDGIESPASHEALVKWAPAGPAATEFNAVAANVSQGQVFYAGRSSGVDRSADGGLTWTSLANAPATDVRAVAVAGATVVAATRNGSIYRSPDDGAMWSNRTPGATDIGEMNKSLAVDPRNNLIMYGGDFALTTKQAGDSYVVKSVDGGASWAHVAESATLGDEIHAYTLAVGRTATTLLAGGGGTPPLARSTDGGSTWSNVSPFTGAVYAAAIDARDGNRHFASGLSQAVFPYLNFGIFRSSDGGASWSAMNRGLAVLPKFVRLLSDEQRTDLVWAAADDGAYLSRDRGATWTPMDFGLATANARYLNDLALSPARRLVAATVDGLFVADAPAARALHFVSPSSGPQTGGTAVTIEGYGFEQGTQVLFGAIAAASVTVTDDRTLVAVTPPHASGTVNATVMFPDGALLTAAAAYTFLPPPPAITGFTPSGGAPGTAVVINGTNLTGANAVDFNGTSAIFSVDSTTQITATVPSNATSGAIHVTTTGGVATSASSFTVAPRITGFTPSSGPVGTAVTISGANFSGATSVKFGGVAATTVTSVSATQLIANVPASAVTGQVSVTTSAGTATSAASFTVTASVPTIASFTPASGSFGAAVTIAGTNFIGATAVKFGGVAATTFTVVSPTQITANVPTGAVTGRITVTTPGGTATSSANFTVLLTGDVDGDGTRTVADVVYLANYLFAAGPSPIGSADVNGSGGVGVADLFYLVNFFFASGPAPV